MSENGQLLLFYDRIFIIFVPKRTIMYISKNLNKEFSSPDLALSQMLEKYMIENHLSASSLASILSVNRKTLANILEGGELKFNHALRIMRLLNISDKDFIALFMNDLEDDDVKNLDKVSQTSFILENFDIEGLKEAGVVNSTIKFEEIEKNICQYFGFRSIYEYNKLNSSSVLFSKSKFTVNQEKSRKMQRFWIKSAYESFSQIGNPNAYDEDLLIDFLKRIKTYTKDIESGFAKVQFILFQLGVTVLVQPYFTKTKAFGISMIVNDKPCIIITDQGKKYHKLWLTLLHELYHVINDYDYITQTNYHITDPENPDLFVSEEDADSFAINAILSEKAREISFKLINSPYKVSEAAKKRDIHPTMIYGIYLESLSRDLASREYPKFSKYLESSSLAIKNIVFDPVKQNGLLASVQRMKKQLNIMSA